MSEQFCIVQFSPSPEYLGHVNVALLVTGAWNRFVCNPRFPQLSRIAPGYDLEQMTNTFIWASASVINMTADGARCFLPDHSGQFKLTAPMPLQGAWTEQTEKKLVETLLGTESEWHPHTERPEPGEYLVCFWSGKMQTARWEHTEFEPAGEWIDPDTDEPLEDYDGQVVAHWRVRPVGPGEVG